MIINCIWKYNDFFPFWTVNESMLTGESVPISKTSLQRNRLTSINSTSSFKEEEKLYDPKEHSKHTLFRGTTVIQTRNHRDLDTIAVVIRTGNFSSSKRVHW